MRVAAFFDMDRTLLRCNTGVRWIHFLRQRREISLWQTLKAVSWLAQYKLSILDMEAVTRVATADMRGEDESAMLEKTRLFFDREVKTAIAPAARDAVELHRKRGDLLVILSSSTPYVTEPLADLLGIEHVLCTRFIIEGGRFAGTHVVPACYGEGKVHWAERFAQEQTVDLSSSWFYTDSYSDLPMLRRVGTPIAVNPDARLRRYARRTGWEMRQW